MCDRCKFNSSNNLANSSNHDVVISYTTSRPFNMVIFIRTLRQTGSNCSVVFFVTDKFLSKVSNDTKNYVLKCGGQFINYHQPTYTELEDDWSDPYIHIHNFIRLNLHELNRIVVCDLYDTVFQGDPFNAYLPKNQLHLADEGRGFDTSNREWISKCARLSKRKLNTLNTICAGYFGGDAVVMKSFFRAFLTNFQFGKGLVDQGCINGWAYGGLFKKYGISVNISNDNVKHLAMVGIKRGQKLGNITGINRNDLTVAILHQVHWNPYLFNQLEEICPKPPGDFRDYLGRCKGCFGY